MEPRRARRGRTREAAPTMKRIGLLGGMSWESSAEYYRLINEATRDRLGGLHSADCLRRSVDLWSRTSTSAGCRPHGLDVLCPTSRTARRAVQGRPATTASGGAAARASVLQVSVRGRLVAPARLFRFLGRGITGARRLLAFALFSIVASAELCCLLVGQGVLPFWWTVTIRDEHASIRMDGTSSGRSATSTGTFGSRPSATPASRSRSTTFAIHSRRGCSRPGSRLPRSLRGWATASGSAATRSRTPRPRVCTRHRRVAREGLQGAVSLMVERRS
jgi:hypothetical protein